MGELRGEEKESRNLVANFHPRRLANASVNLKWWSVVEEARGWSGARRCNEILGK